MESLTTLPEKGALTESILRENVSEVTPRTTTVISLPLGPLIEIQHAEVSVPSGVSTAVLSPARTSHEIPTRGSEWGVFLRRGDMRSLLGMTISLRLGGF